MRLAGDGAIVCDQVLYHLEERGIEHALLPACARVGATLVAYSPFGSGRFPAPSSKGGRVLATVAARHAATPRQIALAFLLRDDHVVTIPKSASVEHVRENAAAAELLLTDDDVAALERAFPRGREPRELPTI